MALVVFLQEDEDVPSVYRNIFVKRPPGTLDPINLKLSLLSLLYLHANPNINRFHFNLTTTKHKDIFELAGFSYMIHLLNIHINPLTNTLK